jgi:hemoglobin-like flavoprotein
MDLRNVELFNDSIERCSCQPEFLRRFYELFVASSGTVAKKFENTDLKRQARMLKTSLYIMMLSGGESEQIAHLDRLATLHNRAGLDIKPELYDLWLDKLVQAAREFDPKFDIATETAWRSVLQPGIDYMKSRY